MNKENIGRNAGIIWRLLSTENRSLNIVIH